MPSGSDALSASSFCSRLAGDREHVPALLHDRDAADDLAGAVEIGDPAAQVVADLQVADVLELHRLSAAVAAEDEELQLVDALAADAAAKLILAAGDLDGPAARFLKRALHRREHVRQRDPALAEQRREQLDLVLLLEPADRRDLRDARRRLQRRLDEALVQQAQLAQVVDALPVDERVLEDPAHAAGVRSDRDVGVRRQLRADRVEPIGDELSDERRGGPDPRG